MVFNRDAFITALDRDLDKVEVEVGDFTKDLRRAEGEIMVLRAILRNILSAENKEGIHKLLTDKGFLQFVQDEFDADQASGILYATRSFSETSPTPQVE